MHKSLKLLLAAILAGSSLTTTTIVLNNDSHVQVAQAMSKKKKIKKAVSIMQDNYDDTADVYYDKKNDVIAIKPTDEEFEDETIAVLDGEESKSDWHKLTNSIDELSETIHDDLHIKTPVAIVNPENTDKVLYMSYDGNSLYDVMDEN